VEGHRDRAGTAAAAATPYTSGSGLLPVHCNHSTMTNDWLNFGDCWRSVSRNTLDDGVLRHMDRKRQKV